MKNIEINRNEINEYINWLENVCLSFITNNKIASKESILKIIDQKGINIENHFVAHLLEVQNNKQKENIVLQKLPLLKSYPIGLDSDVYYEDVDPLYNWELETVKTLLLKLNNQYENTPITPEAYYNFFVKEIKPYKTYFLNDMDMDGMIYDKILPKNISLFWSYRLNKNIPWDKSLEQKNVGISIISIIEGAYLSKDKSMEEFQHLVE